MKAIVHIGTEKTGTSSIQMFLYKNRKKLLKSGYHFLQSAGKTNNWALPALFSVDDRSNDLYRDEGIRTKQKIDQFKLKFVQQFEIELHAIKKNVHTVIISSEHFHSRIRTEKEMKDVHHFLTKYFDEIKIVCYLREQVATCASWYSTSMKSGGILSFEDFFRRCRPGDYYFNYYEMLSNWEKYFGSESLNVALFSQEKFLNGDLLDDFTARIDVALVGILNKTIYVENESLNPAGQALARAVNIILPVSSERAEVIDLRHRCKKIISHGLTGRGQQPEPAKQKLIFDSFIESNERVRQKYFGQVETLFPYPMETALPCDAVDEIAFGVMTDLLSVLNRHGKGVISSADYTHVCKEILASFDDLTKVVHRERKKVTHVNFNKDDARLLRSVALNIEGRDVESAYKLTILASKVRPNLPGIKSKLEEYRQKADKAPKLQYIIAFYGFETSLSQDDKQKTVKRFQDWATSLDIPVGVRMYFVKDTRTIHPNGTIEGSSQAALQGFIIFQAESLEQAVAQAKSCPYLEMGGCLEVSMLVYE